VAGACPRPGILDNPGIDIMLKLSGGVAARSLQIDGGRIKFSGACRLSNKGASALQNELIYAIARVT
jgi:hypothetical protein